MEISPTPQILMQTLLDGTKKVIIEILNSEIPNLNSTEKKTLTEILMLPAYYSFNGGIKPDDCELSRVLKYLWKEWDLLKDKIFISSEENSYGRTTRSYISILMQARNDWAHDTLTYEDVIHYGLVIQRIKKNIQKNVDDSFPDQIIDFCIEKISEKDIRKIEESNVQTNDQVRIINESDKTPDQKELEEKEEDIRTTKTEEGKEVWFEVEIGQSDNESNQEESTEVDNEIVTGQSEEDDKKVNELFDQYSKEELIQAIKIRSSIEEKDYAAISALVPYPRDITVQPGSYPDTLFFSDGYISFAFGVRKIKQIWEYIFEISLFAVLGRIKNSMKGSYQNCDVICIPSNESTNIMFGRNKAQIISNSWRLIKDWLKNYQ
jgi:hypothetical protein